MDLQRRERTALPNTCGEETDLPGVPAVGCVASVTFNPNEAKAVAAVISASSDGIHVLGPDIEKRDGPRREHSLFTRTVWRIPAHAIPPTEHAGETHGTDRAPVNTRNTSSLSPHHPHPATAGDNRANPSSEKAAGSGVTITSLVGFMLVGNTDAAGKGGTAPHDVGGEAIESAGSAKREGDQADTVCVCVSWADPHGTHHVSCVLFSLIASLSRSCTTTADLRLRVHLDALPSLCAPERRGGAVLRLFYHPAFSRASSDERESQSPSAPSEKRHHVVMCSCYYADKRASLAALDSGAVTDHNPSPNGMALDSRQGNGTANGALTTVAKGSPLAVAIHTQTTIVGDRSSLAVADAAGTQAPPHRVVAAPSASAAGAVPGRRGWLAYVKVTYEATTDVRSVANELEATSTPPEALAQPPPEPWLDGSGTEASAAEDSSSPSEDEREPGGNLERGPQSASSDIVVEVTEAHEDAVAPWLWRFQPGRVVLSFSVQGPEAAVIAAAGTADGRVILLTAHNDRTVRRLAGPIPDIGFVDIRPSHGVATGKSRLITSVLQKARRDSGVAQTTAHQKASNSLVALDATGNIIVLHHVNTPRPTSQIVADVPQLITLKDAQARSASFVDSPVHPSPGNDVVSPVSTKSFLDLSSLRRFFSAKHAKTTASPTAATAEPKDTTQETAINARLPHLSSTPVKGATTHDGEGAGTDKTAGTTAAGGDDFHLSGHLLSRGLLYGTWIPSTRGDAELVVSTMGQAIVSIPYNPDEGTFAIAGFTVTPTPMNYIAFTDFFNTGAPELVMTSPHSVLVARTSRDVLRERAAVLTRLLQARKTTSLAEPSTETALLTELGFFGSEQAIQSQANSPAASPAEDDPYVDLLET